MRECLLLGLVVFSSACGLPAHVRPVPRGTLAVEASVGGPAALLGGVPVPLPFATVGASYGVADAVDVHAHAHLTPLLLDTAGLDLGATLLARPEQDWRPALSLTGRAYAFSDLSSGALFYGEASAAASYLLRERYLTYASTTALYDALAGEVIWAVGVGAQVPFQRFALQLEANWYWPTYDAAAAPVSWVSPGGQGAFGLVLGASYRFGGSGAFP
ncbi:MAG: hypothetical protein JXB05_21655 [Myxococcaceae bacterium]|nr:hypothetical protein [Myxococcaceae bacterium]